MKGVIASISLISLLLATSIHALNNFTNPGSFLSPVFPLSCLPSLLSSSLRPFPYPHLLQFLSQPILLSSLTNHQSRRQYSHPSRRRSNNVPPSPSHPLTQRLTL